MSRGIEITTTQNVTIEYELASLRERFVAMLVDLMVLGVLGLLLLWLLVALLRIGEQDWLLRLFALLPVAGFVGYHLACEMLMNGMSLGKKAMGLKVVRLDGKEPGAADFFLRAVFHLVDTLFSSGVVGALMISSSANRQRLGDLAANTAVIRMKNERQVSLGNILQIESLEVYQPRYPEVATLADADLLLVREALERYQRYRNAAHRDFLEALADKLAARLHTERPRDTAGFLKTLLKDYIVLTR